MNSYFASVEQQANSLLRGKPVGVCAYLSARGCIIAASREAKEQGVKTGMRVFEAKRVCSKIVLLENDPAKYRFVSKKVFSLLANISDEIEIYSIDEAFVDLTGLIGNYLEAKVIAQRLKKEIKEQVGEWLTCSVGIASTRWLAKFASAEQKLDGLTIIHKEDLSHIFASRPLQHAWGIGRQMEVRLRSLGIYNLGDLQKAQPVYLRQNLGMYGYYLWCHVNGIEVEGVIKDRNLVPKSIGHSYCLPRLTTDKKYLASIMTKLCLRAAARMRAIGLEAGSIMCGFNYVGGGGVWRSWKLPIGLYDSTDIIKQALQIFSTPIKDRVKFLAIALSSFIPNSNQLSFFKDEIKKKSLSQAIDKLNQRYGEFVVMPANLLVFKEAAPDRIGFRKSVTLDENSEF